MEIKAGKYYRTRDGKKAYVCGVLPKGFETPYPVKGAIDNGDRWADDDHCWCRDGSDYEEDNECDNDLVAEWHEPVGEPDEWVYVGITGNGDAGSCFFSQKEVDEHNGFDGYLKIPAYRYENG